MEARGILPQIMQQTGETGLGAGSEGGGEIGGEAGDVFEMGAERLPFAR